MTYTSKYEVGETVWALIDSRLEQRKIGLIDIHHATNQIGEVKEPEVNYHFMLDGGTRISSFRIPEARVAKNRNVILKRLLLDSEE